MKTPQNVRPTENYIFHNLSLARTQWIFLEKWAQVGTSRGKFLDNRFQHITKAYQESYNFLPFFWTCSQFLGKLS